KSRAPAFPTSANRSSRSARASLSTTNSNTKTDRSSMRPPCDGGASGCDPANSDMTAMSRHVLFRDFETRSVADLRTIGASRYASDPSTGVLCVAWSIDDDQPQICIPGEAPVPQAWTEAAHDPHWSIVSHHDHFETTIETHILHPRFDWPLIPL